MKTNLLETIHELGQKNKFICAIISLFLVAFLGVIDYLTGIEVSFPIFYLIPISFATILNGRTWGLIVSLLGAMIWFYADLIGGAHYSQFLIPYWNAAVRLGYFTLHTFLLSYLYMAIREQRRMTLIDPLTGATNWRYFEEYAHKEIERERRNKKPLTLVYFDLDNFK